MKKINWGIVSSAKIAREHLIPAIQKSKNSRVFGLASRSKEKALKVSKAHKIPNSYDSYKKMYQDKDIQVVYNPLPNHLHLSSTIEACKNKKHVLLEKPITLKAKDVDKLIKVARENKVIVKEAFMVRYHPQWIWAKKYIKQGNIGDVRSILTSFSFFSDDPNNIRNFYSQKNGGGAIYDLGCYPVVISRFLLDQEPKRVVSTSLIHNKFKVDTVSSAILDFGGVFSTFNCSTQSAIKQQVIISGTKKTIVIENPFNPDGQATNILIYKGSSIFRKDNVSKIIPKSNHYKNLVEAFSDHLLKKTKVDYGLADSKKNMKVLDALFKSSKNKKWVKV
ncbi:MAG: NAD-binding protein [Pelagibacteraceae bacterium]|nr:NAD-binding protein [Pelagibacteraceae bacterium]|tara:strand:- start:245 stop:1249 length:1005 start_codon:yes stop_codon:yes gene_type:complete